MNPAMIVDQGRCLGCHTCTLACRAENGLGPGLFWCRVQRQGQAWLRLSCLQCAKPACAVPCPALEQREGALGVRAEDCKGCGACVKKCPWGLAGFSPEDERYDFEARGGMPGGLRRIGKAGPPPGTAGHCDFCAARRAAGRAPACVEACPTAAIRFGDLDDAAFARLWH